MLKAKIIIAALFFSNLFGAQIAIAQKKDSLANKTNEVNVHPPADTTHKIAQSKFFFNRWSPPKKATVLSAILPGAGQFYNKSYWKVPVVYGAIYGVYYLSNEFNKRYIRYKNDYIYATDNDPSTIDEFNGKVSSDILKRYKDYYRRNRDLCYLGLLGVYVLNIIEANVDANLKDFNINDDLALKISPEFISNDYKKAAIGVKFVFNFK